MEFWNFEKLFWKIKFFKLESLENLFEDGIFFKLELSKVENLRNYFKKLNFENWNIWKIGKFI